MAYRLDFAQILTEDGRWEKSTRLMEAYWHRSPYHSSLVDRVERVNDTNGLGEKQSYLIQTLGDYRLTWIKI